MLATGISTRARRREVRRPEDDVDGPGRRGVGDRAVRSGEDPLRSDQRAAAVLQVEARESISATVAGADPGGEGDPPMIAPALVGATRFVAVTMMASRSATDRPRRRDMADNGARVGAELGFMPIRAAVCSRPSSPRPARSHPGKVAGIGAVAHHSRDSGRPLRIDHVQRPAAVTGARSDRRCSCTDWRRDRAPQPAIVATVSCRRS